MDLPIPVSVIILAKNEAANLPRIITSCCGLGQVVVVDDLSSDQTREIARSLGAEVLIHKFSSFADQRNWAAEQDLIRYPWMLHLDADEELTTECIQEIQNSLSFLDRDHVGFFARKVILEERWLRFSTDFPVYVPRLMHSDGPRFRMQGHGETVDAKAGFHFFFSSPLLHYNFSKGWDDWWERHERYAQAEAERISQGLPDVNIRNLLSSNPLARRRTFRSMSYRIPARPFLRFIYLYLFRKGVLDGLAGFRYCRAMAGYERLINQSLKKLRREQAQ